jgi:hypothetical protein
MNCRSRSILEYFVLEGVHEFIKSSPQKFPDDLASTITLLYNAVSEIACSFEEKLPIGLKNIENVNIFLREHDHHLAAFKTLCKMQLKTSIAAALSQP